uniref:Uncharacterized protein n=2 Tax=Timema TaxID=61471 RepID=A0A7R9AT37_TIMSH|nr:unnamed protein product [Timema shepardi]
MVPQQSDSGRSSSPNGIMPTFGSQLVNKNSSTPYTDATQAVKVKTVALAKRSHANQQQLTFARNSMLSAQLVVYVCVWRLSRLNNTRDYRL